MKMQNTSNNMNNFQNNNMMFNDMNCMNMNNDLNDNFQNNNMIFNNMNSMNMNNNLNNNFQNNQTMNNILENKEKEILNLKNELNNARNIIQQQKIKINNLQNQLNNSSNKIQLYQNIINQKDQELNNLKLELNKLKKELKNIKSKIKKYVNVNKMMSVNFISTDEQINLSIPCIDTDKFAEVEEKLYKQFPEYKGTNNKFIANGKPVSRSKTIAQNKIGNGSPVTMIIP
jgi:chromosome segregation ATPase